MNIEEMRSEIEEHCYGTVCDNCLLYDVTGEDGTYCYDSIESDKIIKRNYNILFGEAESNSSIPEIKSGYLVEIKDGRLCVIHQFEEGLGLVDARGDWVTTMKNFDAELNNDGYSIMKIYGYSKNARFYDVAYRELLWERKEDIGKKEWEFTSRLGDIFKITPNRKDYKDGDNRSICFELNNNCYTLCYGVTIDQAKEIIKALQKIIDYVEGEE